MKIRIRLLVASLACSAAFAAGSTSAIQPPYVKIPIPSGTFFDDAYTNSIADSVFIATGPASKSPPIQHLQRTTKRTAIGNLAAEAEPVGKEILNNLGVNLTAKSTLRLRQLPFKGGANRKLNGLVIEYQSRDVETDEATITCMAFVSHKAKLHAIWLQAYQAILPDCSARLVELSRDSSMYK